MLAQQQQWQYNNQHHYQDPAQSGGLSPQALFHRILQDRSFIEAAANMEEETKHQDLVVAPVAQPPQQRAATKRSFAALSRQPLPLQPQQQQEPAAKRSKIEAKIQQQQRQQQAKKSIEATAAASLSSSSSSSSSSSPMSGSSSPPSAAAASSSGSPSSPQTLAGRTVQPRDFFKPDTPSTFGKGQNGDRGKGHLLPNAKEGATLTHEGRVCRRLTLRLLAQKGAEAFSRPVDHERLKLELYLEKIKPDSPIDLGTVLLKLDEQVCGYATVADWLKDVQTVFVIADRYWSYRVEVLGPLTPPSLSSSSSSSMSASSSSSSSTSTSTSCSSSTSSAASTSTPPPFETDATEAQFLVDLSRRMLALSERWVNKSKVLQANRAAPVFRSKEQEAKKKVEKQQQRQQQGRAAQQNKTASPSPLATSAALASTTASLSSSSSSSSSSSASTPSFGCSLSLSPFYALLSLEPAPIPIVVD